MAESIEKGEIILYQPDNTVTVEVRLEKDDVWLNRQQIASLFDRDIKTIGKHINNALRKSWLHIQLSQNLRQLPRTVRFIRWNIIIWI